MRKGTFLAAAVLLGLVSCAAVGGFAHTFTSLATYDDEGVLILLLRRFLAGAPLYDGVWTVYGPLYYWYEWVAHALGGIAPSHDSVRFVSLFFWVATSALMFVFIYRVSRSLLLAAATFCVEFRILRFIGAEPVHPQELCVLLLACVCLVVVSRFGRTWRMAALGALGGALLLTKINLGIFVGIALALTWIYAAPRGAMWRAGRTVVSAGALLFPAFLMKTYLAEPWAQLYAAIVIVSLAAVMVAVSTSPLELETGWRDGAALALGFAGAAAAGCAFAVLHGSSLAGIYHQLVIVPSTDLFRVWHLPSRIRAVSLPWALAALLLAWVHGTRRVPPPWLALLKMGLGLGSVLVSVGNLGNDLIGLGLPFQWLVLVAPEHGPTTRVSGFARMTLAFVSVMQALYAYPVAGSQVWILSMFLLGVAALCFADGLADVCAYWPEHLQPQRLRWAGAFAWVLLGGLFLGSIRGSIRQYRAQQPLSLPGAKYLRLAPERVALLHRVATTAGSQCGTLLTIPWLPSFNLWTGRPVQAELYQFHWIAAGLQPREVMQHISGEPNVCVLYADREARFMPGNPDDAALVREIRREFRPILQVDEFELLRH